MTDALLSHPDASERTCADCHCRLARDNKDTVCWPCRRRRAIAAQEEGARSVRRQEIFEVAGIPGLAAEMGVTRAEAIRYAIEEEILSRRWRPHLDSLIKLSEMSGCTHVEAAQALGVSRWTVADWRRRLGLESASARRSSASADS
jgi:hypothetical protein